MTNETILFSLFGQTAFSQRLADLTGYEVGAVELHRFPDGEALIQFESTVKDREVVFVDSLDMPDKKILPLLFAAKTAKALGATRVGLIAPYLAYMRQDKQFITGQGITAKYFAELISAHFASLITVEPHLHRVKHLNEIYSIPTKVIHADMAIANWISENINDPFLIGPDEESAPWVSSIAERIDAPYAVCKKIRAGDNDVAVSIDHLPALNGMTPVIVDDIVSTGHTMIETMHLLSTASQNKPVTVVVHPLFRHDKKLTQNIDDLGELVACNTLQLTQTGDIDIAQDIVSQIR